MQTTEKGDRPQPKSDLTDYEREQLRDLTGHPGWPIVLKIMDGYIEAIKAGTQAVSLNDPLANADRIAQMWAYYGMTVRVALQLQQGVKREIEWLSKPENMRTPEQEAERLRQWYAVGEIGAPPNNWEPRKH
jgi:hypothetical protein